MSPENSRATLPVQETGSVLTPEEHDELELTALAQQMLGEQFTDLEQQHEAAALGMWIFLATEVMFFGTLFLGVSVYRFQYPEPFEKASAKLNWIIGGVNTVVLLVSSLFMVLGVHYARLGQRKRVVVYLCLTAGFGVLFLFFKGYEYYTDYVEYLIPGWRFNADDWVVRDGLTPEQVPQVQLFLLFYWVMTGLHGLHVFIGIVVVLVMAWLTSRGSFSPEHYSPIDVTGLYWHFVDTVWIFLLPMLYLLSTHTWADFHL